MTINFTGTDTNGVTVNADNETWITRQDRVVANDGTAFSFGGFSNSEYFLQGDLFATATGIFSASGAVNLSVVVGLGGSINAGASGIRMDSPTSTIKSHNVVNDGSITSEGGNAIAVNGGASDVVNNGFVSAELTGVVMIGESAEIRNFGQIYGGVSGIFVEGEEAKIFNHGDLSGEFSGLRVENDDATIVNTGTITSDFTGISLFGSGSITNSGTINAGGSIAVAATTDGDVRFANSGTVDASATSSPFAYLGGNGADTVINTGTMLGNVDLRAGNDLYNGATGVVSDGVFGGFGDDTLIGSADNDRLDGGGGTDDVRGGRGEDSLSGGNGADMVSGGKGDDTIRGGNGTDTIAGGKGDDQLSGGLKADVFVFARAAGDDVITDFENGSDRIDVSAFGLAGFGQLAPAVTQVGGDTVIDWDVVGGEGQLILAGETGTINGADFIF